ncbi:ABC transporter substrate-binding protein [uncultured Jatrophihabitans sp.]|uniref:ABC transporter substrate-binding protein n=1 Tax=uncultured Jatrophihabitans sp. TaxID=1610747 RepID=UPI0035CB646C
MQRHTKARFRNTTVCLAAAATVTALSACSSESGKSGDAGGAHIKVAVASNAVNYAAFWVASGENLFKKHGVTVDVVNANALAVAPSLLTSGRTDLLLTSASQEISVAAAGKPINIIQAMFNYSPRGLAFVGSSKVKSMAQLKAKGSNCKIATTQKGTAVYAFARQVARAYGLKCSLTELTTNPLEVAAMTAGRADAAAFTPADAVTVIARGAHALIDPSSITDRQAAKIVPKPFPILTVSGLTSTLKKKSPAVERFLAGLQEGLGQLRSESADEVAAILAKTPYFQGLSAAQLAQSLKPAMSSFPSGARAGVISEADWTTALKSFQLDFGLPGFDAKDPKFGYATIVNMSYLKKSKDK